MAFSLDVSTWSKTLWNFIINSNISHFELLNIEFVRDERIDISESQNVRKIIDVKPDFIFHLAAQAIVSKSYDDPLFSFRTILGNN